MINIYAQHFIDEKCPYCNVQLEKTYFEIHEFNIARNEGKAMTCIMCPRCTRIYNEEEITIIG